MLLILYAFNNFIFFYIITFSSCTKTEVKDLELPSTKQEAMNVYKEALSYMEEGQFLMASEKFDQSESLLPQTEWAAKSALMSSYCLYTISFYDEAILNLKRFKKLYPADPNIDYASYLIAVIYYEQILDEKKDIEKLIFTKDAIEDFLKNILILIMLWI